MQQPSPVWDRHANRVVQEWMGDPLTLADTDPDEGLAEWLGSFPVVDKVLDVSQKSRRSAKRIEPFVRKYKIDMSEFEPKEYESFADFFDRRFRPGVRSFPTACNALGAFCEGRYFAWETMDAAQRFPVKGCRVEAEQLLGTADRVRPFVGGPVFVARLAAPDYHHVHYPDAGTTIEHDRFGGRLWTAAWKALQSRPDLCLRNEHEVHILETQHFGRLGIVEVGARAAGRIVQAHSTDEPFARGDRKSSFRFGGSAVVLFGEPGAWRPSEDLVEHTQHGFETFVRLGERIATGT